MSCINKKMIREEERISKPENLSLHISLRLKPRDWETIKLRAAKLNQKPRQLLRQWISAQLNGGRAA